MTTDLKRIKRRLDETRGYDDNFLNYGLVQPQDTFTECFILSKILSNNQIGTVALILKPDDFYLESHNLIYSACLNVFIEGQNVDLLSCRNELIKLEKLEAVGGIHYLTKIVQDHYTFHDVEAMACLIRDLSIKRKVIKLCTEKIKVAFENSSHGYELLSETMNSIDEIQESLISKDIQDLKSILKEIREDQNKEAIFGYTTGIKELDEATNGIKAPEFTIIGAGTGEGKSVFGLQLATAMAEQGHSGIFFTFEMDKKEVTKRLVSRKTGYSTTEIDQKEYWCNESQTKKPTSTALIYEKTLELENLPIHFHDSGVDSYLDIGSIIKAELKRKKIKWVIIDYLQLIPPGTSSKSQTRDQEISKMTKYLKSLTQKLKIPIIALAQVNRGKNRKKYSLNDLRESGSIEQDANNVFFIFRPIRHDLNFYELDDEQTIDVTEYTAILQVEKQRSGKPNVNILLEFHGKTSEFKSTKQDQTNSSPLPTTLTNDESLPF